MMINDIQGILGLPTRDDKPEKPKPAVPKKPGKPKKTAADIAKKLLPNSMGISMEGILSQIQDRAPPYDHLAVSMKKYGKKPVRKWNRVAFTNSARSDGLKLFHYQREDSKEHEYAFASLNQKYPIPKYTDELYTAAFVDDDWSREETDYMLDLVGEYSLMWEVITDRYSFNGKKRGSLEIQKRFYQIEDYVKAFRNEQPSGFDYEAEQERRTNLTKFLDCTGDEADNEEKILKEYEKLKKIDTEWTIKKRSQDLQNYTKNHRPESFAMLNAAKIQQRAAILQRRSLLSPLLSPLKSPTETQPLNLDQIRDFGLTARPVYAAPEFTPGAQSAGEIYNNGPTHKMKFYLSISDFYGTNKLFSYNNVLSTFKVRKNLNCIAEQKGVLMLLLMEAESLTQQLTALNADFEPIPEKYLTDHFMKPRPTTIQKNMAFASFFSVVPPVFPPSDPIDYSSGEARRKKNMSLINHDAIEVPEGVTARVMLSPSPVRQVVGRKRKKLSAKLSVEEPAVNEGSVDRSSRRRFRTSKSDTRMNRSLDPAEILAQRNTVSDLAIIPAKRVRRSCIGSMETSTPSTPSSLRSKRFATRK